MSSGFFLLLGVSVVLTIVGIAAGAVHADMVRRNGKGDAETVLSNTSATATILGLVVVLMIWPFSTPWYKAKPMDSVYKLTAKYMAPPKMAGVKPKDAKDMQKIYHYIRLVLISAIYSLIWGVLAQAGSKAMKDSLLSGGGGPPRGALPKKGHASPWR